MVIGFFRPNEKYGFCSNWYMADISIDDQKFVCCEQYMMYMKAMLFDDIETAKKILATTNPKEMKALGRQVKNFDEKEWDKAKKTVVFTAVAAKFQHHQDLWEKLDATGDDILVEASPYDRIWGIGIDASQDIQNKNNWRGTNLLGEILMQVREFLRENSKK